MTDSNLLKSIIAYKGMTLKECAEAIGMPVSTFSSKVNNNTEFKPSEISAIQTLLELDAKEVQRIFLAERSKNGESVV